MPGTGWRSRGALAAAGLLYVAVAAGACPFCPPSTPPLSEQLAESQIAVLVKWVRVVESPDDPTQVETVFEVVEGVRPSDKEPPRGGTVKVNFLRQGQPGDLFVLLGKRDESGLTDWAPPLEVTEVSYHYLRQAPSLERPAAERLKFFLKFLEFPDTTIANDAFAEFSRAKYADVVQLTADLPRAKLRAWLKDPATTKMRLGFYALLLGLCGEQADAEYLASRVLPPPDPQADRIGVDGMMGGYVLLTGEAGLERLVQAKLVQDDVPAADFGALLNTLRFLWEFAPERVPRERVAAAMRLVLRRPGAAELAVIDLARWKDWGALEQLRATYGQPPLETVDARRKVLQFALVCVKQTAAAEPAGRLARQFVEERRRAEPELVAQVEAELRPRPARKAPDAAPEAAPQH